MTEKQYPIIPLNGKLYMVDETQSVSKGYRYWVNGEGSGYIGTFDSSKYGWPLIASNDDSVSSLPKLPTVERKPGHLAIEAWNEIASPEDADGAPWYVDGWARGYEAAKGEGKYSEEDMRRAFLQGQRGEGSTATYMHFEDFLDSLNKHSIPTAVVVEMEYVIEDFSGSMNVPTYADVVTPKTDKDNTIIVKRWIWK